MEKDRIYTPRNGDSPASGPESPAGGAKNIKSEHIIENALTGKLGELFAKRINPNQKHKNKQIRELKQFQHGGIRALKTNSEQPVAPGEVGKKTLPPDMNTPFSKANRAKFDEVMRYMHKSIEADKDEELMDKFDKNAYYHQDP